MEDLDLCVRYFIDFGLPLIAREGHSALFELEEGSSVIIRPLAEARVEGTAGRLRSTAGHLGCSGQTLRSASRQAAPGDSS